MKSPSPEVKIAFLGIKGAGKTTLVNALLRGKYSDSSKCCKNGIKSFRVVYKSDAAESSKDEVANKPDSTVTMNVELENALFDAHRDVNLVLIDVPGIPSSNAQDYDLKYVDDQWASFDCVVVVLNAGKGFLEQLDFLHWVKKNLITRKELPILFVCNKVDAAILNQCFSAQNFEQLRKLVKSIFTTTVIPISAYSAYLYGCAAELSFERFCQLERKMIDKIGSSAFDGWCSPKCTFGLFDLFEYVNGEFFNLKYMVASNFPNFLEALSRCIDDCKEQYSLDSKPSASSQ